MSPVVASRRFSPARLLTLLVANLVWLVPMFLAPATNAGAQIVVNSLTDDAPGSAASCPATCTLRDAILAANAAPGSTIQFQSGLAGTYQLSAALPAITVSTTITGNSDPGLVVVAGSPTVPALSIQTGAVASSTVTISGFTVANTGGGSIAGFGSGLFIYNPPTGAYVLTVDVTNMVFSNNAAGDGGAITVDGTAAPLTNGITLNVVGSTFTGNTSTSNGGAIWNGGALTITSSTFSANSSLQGAGIYNCNDGATCFGSGVISDSTFANNTNPGGSGTIYNANAAGAVTVHDSTFSGNSPQTGGSIANAGTLTVTNTVFVNASPGSGNQCTTATTGCPASPQSTADTNGDLQDTAINLKMGSLTNNGGLTQTLLPQTGSPVLCGGTSAGALTVSGGTLTADQRGFPLDPNCALGQTDSGSVQVGGGTITVTTLTDDSGTPAGNAGNCPGVNCSLRDAIAKANGAGTATINFNVTGTITLGAELPLGSGNIVINGPGAGSLTLSGAGKYRILENFSGSMSVSGITFDSANSGGQGGAFVNAAVGTLDHVAFTNNTGTSGGAIYSIRSLTITNSTFSGNSVGAGNGGAIDTTGTLSVSNSTFNNNTAAQGAAIYDESDAALPVSYSTFANNTNSLAGTITTNSQSIMTIANSTFFGNTAAAEDQDIFHNGGTLTVTNTIIGDTNGCGTTPDAACTAAGAGNVLPGVGLTLSALGNHGGPTNTLLPLPGSTAICGGVLAKIPSGFSTEQRGFSNATPGTYGCAGTASDAGSVQTDYTSGQFAAATYSGNAATPINPPPVTVTITENGINQGDIPVTIGVTGVGTVTGNGPVNTVAGTGAAFTSLQVSAPGTGTASIDPITVTGTYVLPAGAIPTATLNIRATGATTTTTVGAASAPFNAATQNVTLTATVTSTSTVNEGQVIFTVAGGTFPGTQVAGAVVGGAATVSYPIPAAEAVGAYTITGVYSDTGGAFNTSTGTNTLDITGPPTITFTIANHTYGDAPFNATATSNSAGAITYSLVSGNATVSPAGLVTLTGAGTVVVKATQAPSGFYTTGSQNATFSVAPATPVLSITNSPVTYNAAAQSATIVATATGITGNIPGVVSNVLYGGSATVPTNAGTYAVTATFTPTSTTNFNTVIGVTAGNFVISKATPTLSVSNSPAPYTGTPVAAVVVANVTGITGTIAGTASSVLYNGSATVPTAAATYAITATFTPTDTTNFNTVTGVSAGNFIIGKSTPTLSVTNSPVTYNATAQAATVTGSVPGTVSNVQYNGVATVPTAAGTYAITANFVPTDTTNYSSVTGGAAGNFIINKATPILAVTNSPATYTGAAQTATVAAAATGIAGNVAGVFSAELYNGSATAPTAAGTYAVTITFTPTDTTNYSTVTAGSAGNFIIGKATPILSVTNSPVTYTGTAQTATLSAGGVAGVFSSELYNGSATAPTAAGTYAVTATFTPTDTANYNTVAAGSAGNFIIGKATPTLSVTNSPVVYTGAPQAATVAGSVAGTVSAVLYNGSATVPTIAATYAVTANFTPSDTANYNTVTAGAAGNFIIGKATPTLSVTNSPQPFTGTPQTATVVGSVPGTVSAILYNGSVTAPTAAATYAISANFVPTDTTNYNSLTAASAGNFIIGKSNPTLSITNSPVTYTGAAQAAVVTGSVPGTVSAILYNGSATVPTAAGTYAVTANFAPTDATDYNSLTAASAGNFVIGKANPTLSVTNSPVTYTGNPQTATVTGSVPGTVSAILYNGSATVPTAAGTYAITANFTPTDTTDYATLTGGSAGNFVIGKLTPTLSVTNSPVTFTGAAQAATVAGSVPGTVSAILYNGSATVPSAAGTYAITANFTPTDTTDYAALTAAAAGSFVIGKATPTLAVTNSPVAFTGTAQAAVVAGSVPGTVSAILYNGSATVPSAAGTYAITATFVPTDTADYNSLTAAAAGNFIIGKGTPTLSVTNSPLTYNGAAQAAVVTGSVPGTVSSILYSGSATVPTAAGTYAITANFTPTDAADYSSLTAASAGNFVIAKSVPTVSVTNSPVPFTGNPQAASVTGSVPGTVTAVLYNGSATVPTAAGTYAITANFTPTDTTDYTPLTAASAGNFVIGTIAPTITFTVPNHTFGDAPFTVTATSNSAGAITFSAVSGPATIAGATVTLTGAGTVALKASQVAAGNYTAGTQNATFTVAAGTPILKWTPATTIGYGTSLSALLNATVSFGGNTVAGTFAYTATPTGGTASAVTSGTILPEGTYTLAVTFTPTDATDYKTATATSPLTVTGQTLTVTANNATKVYGTANPTFTGSVTGAVNGDTFTESFATTATTTSNAGTYPIVPSVTGANLSNYTVVVDDGTLTVSQAGTTITLTASGSSVNPGTSVTLTATVASATTGTPTGIVTFYDGSTALGTGTLATGANGDVATFSTSSLLSGTHTITAVYAGDTNFTASSTSSSITITVAPLGFTLNVTPPSNTGNKGTTFTYNLAVAPAFAGTPYPGTVSFAANGGPAGAVITFTPSTLAASAGPQTVSMSVATSANAALQPLSTGHKLVPVAFALFLLPLAGTRRMRRNGQRLGRFICLLLLALAGVAATTALSGCGSNAGGTTTVNKGTQYTITVTATSGSVTQNAAVTLTLN